MRLLILALLSAISLAQTGQRRLLANADVEWTEVPDHVQDMHEDMADAHADMTENHADTMESAGDSGEISDMHENAAENHQDMLDNMGDSQLDPSEMESNMSDAHENAADAHADIIDNMSDSHENVSDNMSDVHENAADAHEDIVDSNSDSSPEPSTGGAGPSGVSPTPVQPVQPYFPFELNYHPYNMPPMMMFSDYYKDMMKMDYGDMMEDYKENPMMGNMVNSFMRHQHQPQSQTSPFHHAQSFSPFSFGGFGNFGWSHLQKYRQTIALQQQRQQRALQTQRLLQLQAVRDAYNWQQQQRTFTPDYHLAGSQYRYVNHPRYGYTPVPPGLKI